jgi:tryptophan-rich sensory protein
MSAIVIVWLAVEALGLVDAFRHSATDWHYADRERSFWVTFMFFLGPIFVVPYLVLVRPRFPGAAPDGRSDRYLKR